MSKTVGVIGLGPMGGSIAGNLLQKQFSVCGYDIKPDCMAALDKLGLTAGKDAADVAAQADIVIASLPNYAALQDVVAQVIKAGKKGQVLIECSTLQVDQKIAASVELKAAGITMLDAPISATPAMLAKGLASIHISGDEAAYKDNVDVFEGFTASNFYVGKIGNGSRMKILANYLVHVHIAAAAEAMVLGQKAGLEPELIHEVLTQSAGNSMMLEVRGAMMAKSDYREGGGTMFQVYEKDSGIITEFAAEVHAPIDLYVSSRQKFNTALAQGLGHLDTGAVCRAIETSVGINRKLVE